MPAVTVRRLLTARRAEILDLAARRGVTNVRLFGSTVRGEDRPDSDIDLLVTVLGERTLLDVCGLAVDLEQLLGRSVDVVPDDHLRPRVRERVLAEAVLL